MRISGSRSQVGRHQTAIIAERTNRAPFDSDLITNKTPPRVLTSISSISHKKQSDRVFIIGGGPSLTGFNFQCLKDEDTICVNSAVFDVPQPNFFVTKDNAFLRKQLISCLKFEKNTKKNWDVATKIFIACFAEGTLQDIGGKIVDTRLNLTYDLRPMDWVIKNDKQFGISLSLDDFRCGVDSGYGALQLAVLLSYRRIYFLGYGDMSVQGKTHYHNRYGERRGVEFQKKLDGYFQLYIKAFQEIKNMNQIELYSCSPISRFNKYLEYIPINKILG